MNDFFKAIRSKKSGAFLLIGCKEEIEKTIKTIIKNYESIIRYTLNNNNPPKKEEFEPLWNHISMNWEDDPQIIAIENIEVMPSSILHVLVQQLDKEYENVCFILTTKAYEAVEPSIKTRSIKFFLNKKNEQNQHKKIINSLTSKETEATEIDQLIDNLNISLNDVIFIAEKILQQLSMVGEFEKMKRIKKLVSIGILPETQKHLIRAIYTILHSN
jgi:hypothetical protein